MWNSFIPWFSLQWKDRYLRKLCYGIDKTLFLLLRSHVGVGGFQFAEFWEDWQVEEFDPDNLDSGEHEKVATVSNGYLPFSGNVV